MSKAQTSFPYNPSAIDFWESNYILYHMVKVLNARTDLQPGDGLRVILTEDDGSPSLFMQGEDLETLKHVLRYIDGADKERYQGCFVCGEYIHTEDCFIKRTLDKVGHEAETAKQTEEVHQPEGAVSEET